MIVNSLKVVASTSLRSRESVWSPCFGARRELTLRYIDCLLHRVAADGESPQFRVFAMNACALARRGTANSASSIRIPQRLFAAVGKFRYHLHVFWRLCYRGECFRENRGATVEEILRIRWRSHSARRRGPTQATFAHAQEVRTSFSSSFGRAPSLAERLLRDAKEGV